MLTGSARRPQDDSGQVMLLIICYTLLALVLVLVAIDAADTFLVKREMASAADAAALAAAQSVDRTALYAGAGCVLPLDPTAATSAADALLAASEPQAQSAVDIAVGGRTVTVVLFRRVSVPFQGLLGAVQAGWSAGVPVRVSASARAPLTGAGC